MSFKVDQVHRFHRHKVFIYIPKAYSQDLTVFDDIFHKPGVSFFVPYEVRPVDKKKTKKKSLYVPLFKQAL